VHSTGGLSITRVKHQKAHKGHVKRLRIYPTSRVGLASISKERGGMCPPTFRKTSLVRAWRQVEERRKI
jgi:hypothetical protein